MWFREEDEPCGVKTKAGCLCVFFLFLLSLPFLLINHPQIKAKRRLALKKAAILAKSEAWIKPGALARIRITGAKVQVDWTLHQTVYCLSHESGTKGKMGGGYSGVWLNKNQIEPWKEKE